MPKIIEKILELDSMKNYPQELNFCGNLNLLKRKKISIIGSRKPTKYSREMTQSLSLSLSKVGVCVVSGGAMGIDAIAHKGAMAANTIAVLPCGINVRYPAVNKNLLYEIEKEGLLLSQFEDDAKARPYTFVLRNELVVALGDVLVVGEAELDSGSMRSIEFALKMKKDIYVFPQRFGESRATNELLKKGLARAIYDIDEFVEEFSGRTLSSMQGDDFIEYCKNNPTYEEALQKYPSRIFEAELSGEIEIRNAVVYLM